jgi:hypothetical protein
LRGFAAAFGGRDLDVSWPDLERRFIVARPFRRDCSGSRGSTGSGLRHLPNSRQAFPAGSSAACVRAASSRQIDLYPPKLPQLDVRFLHHAAP